MVPIRQKSSQINVADVEHIAALAAGGLLVLKGLRHRGMLGPACSLLGLALLFRGQQGYRRLYELFGIDLPATPTGVGQRSIRLEAAIDVDRPRQEVYRIWRNLGNLPVFMDHLLSVHEIDDQRSLWVARAPCGTVIKWDAEIINDVEDGLIAWTTLEGSGVDHVGSVHFEDAGHGRTRVRIVMRYSPPGEALGAWLAKLLGSNPQRQIERDLERFKAIMEVGSKATTQASLI
jgi:uncharacterized membrane protein